MRRSARILLAVASLAIVCCSTAAPADAGRPRLEFTTIEMRDTSGFRDPVDEVITDADEWARVWAKIHTGAEPMPPLPEVDFTRRMVVFTALGVVRSSGFWIEVTDVTVKGHWIEVHIREEVPGGCLTQSAETQPYHAIELDRAGPVVFRRHRIVSHC